MLPALIRNHLLRFCLLLTANSCFQREPQKQPSNQPPKEAAAAEPFSYIDRGESIDWRTVEAPLTTPHKKAIAAALAPYFKGIQSTDGPTLPLIESIHLLDLNGDQHLDVVYNGPVGAESNIVWLFVNEHGYYRKLRPEWWGEIKYLSFRRGRLVMLTLLDFGCCAEYIEFETKYVFNQRLEAAPVLQRGTAHFTQRPVTEPAARPQPVLLAADSVAVRAAPIVNDTSTFVYDAVGEGNVLLKCGKNTQGLVWAIQTDSIGQQWQYIEMLPTLNATSYLMYSKGEIPTRTFGWVRATDTRPSTK